MQDQQGLPEFYLFAMNPPVEVAAAEMASSSLYQGFIRPAHERMPDEHGYSLKCKADIAEAMRAAVETDGLDAVLFAAAEAFARLGYLSSYCGARKEDVGLE